MTATWPFAAKRRTSMKTNLLMNLIRMAPLSAFTLLPGMACSYSATSQAVGAGGGYATIRDAPGRLPEAGSTCCLFRRRGGRAGFYHDLLFGEGERSVGHRTIIKG